MSILINFFRGIARRISDSDVWVVTAMVLGLVFTGAFSYMRLEGWSFLDALYATVITISTVGYGDLSPQTSQGRLFAIFFTFIAIGIGGYAISTLAANLIENRAERRAKYLRRRHMVRIEALTDHFIICGADMVGLRIAEEFYLSNVSFIIIEEDEEKLKRALLFTHPDYLRRKLSSVFKIEDVDLSEYEDRTVAELAEMLDAAYILDDPNNDMSLVKAGIAQAQGILAALADERDNLAIVVSAKALAQRNGNDGLRIMARVENTSYMSKMYLAGAHYVRNPSVTSGQEMAVHMLNPEVGNWWYSFSGVHRDDAPRMVQRAVADYPKWIGRTVTDLHQAQNILTMAVKRDGTFLTPPPADLVLAETDILVILLPINAEM